MNEDETLRNKMIPLGKLGVWITVVTIAMSLFGQVDYQLRLWSENWVFRPAPGGFTAEDLKQSPAREIVSAVSFTRFLFNLAITTTILFLFRAMWTGRAFSRRTATLATALGILCILGVFDFGVLPLQERSEGSEGSFYFAIGNLQNVVIGLLALALGRIVRFATEQERQLEEIV